MAKTAIKKGSRLKFKGYEDLPDGMEPIFEKGDVLIVESAKEEDDGQFKVKAYREDDPDKEQVDTVFVPGEAEVYDGKGAKAKTKAEPPAKAATKKSKKVEVEEDEFEEDEEEEEIEEEDDEEVDEEEEAPRSKAKASKKAAPAKTSSKKEKSSKAKKAPARTQEEGAEEVINHYASVKKIIKKGTSDMLDAAKNLIVRAGQSYFELGGVLAEIYRTKAYAELGFKGEKAWEQYLNAELGIEYRKAMDFIGIYKVFSELSIDEARLVQFGYTKMRLLARVAKGLSAEEVDALMDEVEDLTRDELEDHVKESVVNGKGMGGDKVRKIKFGGFTAFADEGDFLNASIERAQELVDNGDYNSALKHIIREWASMVDGVDISLEDAISVIETRFKVKLEVVGDDQDEDEEEDEAPAKSKKKASAPVKPAPKKEAPKTKAAVKPTAKVSKLPTKKPAPKAAVKPAAKKVVSGKRRAA